MALPYIQIRIDDYLKDTRFLTTEEHGAYLLLIFHYWQTERALDDTDGKLGKIVGVSRKKWKNLKINLEKYFSIENNVWTHSRIEFDLERVISKQKKASHAASEGVRKRENLRIQKQTLERLESERRANAEHSQSHTDANTDANADKDSLPQLSVGREEVFDLCGQLADGVEVNLMEKSKNPEKVKRPTISQGWLKQMALLIQKDGHEVDEVREIIEWAIHDEFWSSNIMSPAKLRKQFDQLVLKKPVGPVKPKPLAHAKTTDPKSGEEYCQKCGSSWPCLAESQKTASGF